MRILVEIGGYSLDLMVAPETDFDDRFRAICNDTAEALTVNGWLADSIEIASDDSGSQAIVAAAGAGQDRERPTIASDAAGRLAPRSRQEGWRCLPRIQN